MKNLKVVSVTLLSATFMLTGPQASAGLFRNIVNSTVDVVTEATVNVGAGLGIPVYERAQSNIQTHRMLAEHPEYGTSDYPSYRSYPSQETSPSNQAGDFDAVYKELKDRESDSDTRPSEVETVVVSKKSMEIYRPGSEPDGFDAVYNNYKNRKSAGTSKAVAPETSAETAAKLNVQEGWSDQGDFKKMPLKVKFNVAECARNQVSVVKLALQDEALREAMDRMGVKKVEIRVVNSEDAYAASGVQISADGSTLIVVAPPLMKKAPANGSDAVYCRSVTDTWIKRRGTAIINKLVDAEEQRGQASTPRSAEPASGSVFNVQ